MPNRQFNQLFFACCCMIFLAGCGNSDPNRVSGVVKLDGENVVAGRVIFTPDRDKGNSGQRAFADIKKGRFMTIQEQPVSPGPNQLVVSIHPNWEEGMAEIKYYKIDMEIPVGGLRNLVVNLSDEHSTSQ